MSEILTEKKALKMLGADNFRNLTKDQILEFISSIPNMDKDLAMKCLDKIPFYTECASKVTEAYFKLCNSVLNAELSEIDQIEIDAYKVIFDDCRNRICKYESDNIPMSHEEYMDLMTAMHKAAEGISSANDRKTNFQKHLLNAASTVMLVTFGGLLSVFGVRVKLPK